MSPFNKAWSPYFAGVLIGLLQVPAFLIIETALGASSSYVTVGAGMASLVDPSLLDIDYVARHVATNAKNLWQVALVAGIGLGALVSMKMSGAVRAPISPIWRRALGSSSRGLRYTVAFVAAVVASRDRAGAIRRWSDGVEGAVAHTGTVIARTVSTIEDGRVDSFQLTVETGGGTVAGGW